MKKNSILALLALVFMAPGFTAYLFFIHPQWLHSHSTNKGMLINPPEQISTLDDSRKWRIIVWYPAACEQACWQMVDRIARIRLALGRHLYEVNEVIATDEKISALSDDNISKLRDADIKVIKIKEADKYKQLAKTPLIFIANPANYLVLRYQSNVPSADIYHDIKLLLGSGH